MEVFWSREENERVVCCFGEDEVIKLVEKRWSDVLYLVQSVKWREVQKSPNNWNVKGSDKNTPGNIFMFWPQNLLNGGSTPGDDGVTI